MSNIHLCQASISSYGSIGI